MIVPSVGTGVPVAVCEGRALTKRDVSRWVVRTRPNSAGTDGSFLVGGSTIEQWKNQVVRVVEIKRAQVKVEDKEGNQFLVNDEMSNDEGWLTLEEFKDKKVTYFTMSYESFIRGSKKLDKSDEGKTFVRIKPFGVSDSSFMPRMCVEGIIEWNSVVVKDFKPNHITILPYFGFNTVLKGGYAESDGWIEISVFKAAMIKKGYTL